MILRPTVRRRIRGYMILGAVIGMLAGVGALMIHTYNDPEASDRYAFNAQNPSPLFGGNGNATPSEFKSMHDPTAFKPPPPPPGAGAPGP